MPPGEMEAIQNWEIKPELHEEKLALALKLSAAYTWRSMYDKHPAEEIAIYALKRTKSYMEDVELALHGYRKTVKGEELTTEEQEAYMEMQDVLDS